MKGQMDGWLIGWVASGGWTGQVEGWMNKRMNLVMSHYSNEQEMNT